MAKYPDLCYPEGHEQWGQLIKWNGYSEAVSQFFKLTNIEPITDKRFSKFFEKMKQTLSASYTWSFTSLEEMAGY